MASADDSIDPRGGDPLDDAATALEKPHAGLIAHSAPDTAAVVTHQPTTEGTLVEAMRVEEVERTRLFLKLMLGFVLAVSLVLPLMGGHPVAKLAVAGALTGAALTMAWLLRDSRSAAKFALIRFGIGGVVLAICSFAGIFYFGIYSPAPAILVLGIYFYGLGAHAVSVAIVYATCAILQLAAAVLVISGLIPDVGLIRAASMTGLEQVLIQLLVQMLYAAAFLTARFSRRITLSAVARLERAVRQVAERDALLREARQDLDRALRIGGPGRYTDQVLGSFRLGPLLGRGGMGEVYEASHVQTQDPAAVKLLHQRSLDNPDHVTRFFREVHAIASIDEPHVVSVIEVGTTDGTVPYFAMELLTGKDLAHILRRRRRLAVSDVIAMVDQIGRGLAAAHSAGIVHRDVKPQNLFLARTGDGQRLWKILDFGVSKLTDHHGTLTRGQVVGTPGYMAPEQARGEEVDHRADVYSLASIAYRALTGQPPFVGKDVPATLFEVVYAMPTRPSALVDLPRQLDLVLAIGLAKRRSDRFDSGVDLAVALAEAVQGILDPALQRRALDLLARLPWRGESAGS